MNPFAGIASWGNAPIVQRLERPLTEIIARRCGRRPQVWRTAHAVFVQSEPDTPHDDRRALFAADVRLDNRDEIATASGLAPSVSDAALVRHVFETKGDAGISSLLGAFAFVHWDEDDRRLILVRDCLGRRPLFYHRGDGFAVFASFLPDLLSIPGVPHRIDETMMANFLALEHGERERTPYRDIDRVASRTRATITRDGVHVNHYWTPPVDAPPPFKRDEDYIERARELFDRAVARCLRDEPRAAILTSGGLDSSAAAATAARLGHGDVTCYTGLPPDGFDIKVAPSRYLDERPKVEALARLHPSLNIRFVTPRGVHSFQEDSTRVFVHLGIPLWSPVDRGWFETIEDAVMADGHRVMLNGGMGNIGLTWPGDFSLVELARQWRPAALLNEAKALARVGNRPLWHVLKNEFVQRIAPRGMTSLAMRLRGQDALKIGAHSLLNPDAIEALDLRRRWKETGLDSLGRMQRNAKRLRARLLFDNLQIGRDFRAMNHAFRGYETRGPHSDRELLEFCLCVPETLYRRNGIPRWFARQVFADRLPPEILDEHRRGVQSPNWFESVDARKPLIAADIERIEASALASRLIDVPRLRRLLAEWPKDAHEARVRARDYRLALDRAVHVGQFIHWVEGGNG